MKIVFRTLAFHLIMIIVFAWSYFYLSDRFESSEHTHYNNVVDFLLLSTTIQAGVGISNLYPVSLSSKLVMIIQQFIMMSTHIFTLYVFTI